MRAAVKYSPAGVLFRVSPVPDFIKATVPGVAGGTDKETAFIELDPCLSGDAGTPLPLLQERQQTTGLYRLTLYHGNSK
jgi:hypothetical protein